MSFARDLLGRLRRLFAADPAPAIEPDDGDVLAPDPPPPPPDIPMMAGRLSRRCYCRQEIHLARQQHGAASGPMPHEMPCPDREELVSLGLFELTREPAMSGHSLTAGPFRVERQCCYDVTFWWTGRPLFIEGRLRVAPLVRARRRTPRGW